MQQPDMNNLVTSIPKPLKWIIPDALTTDHATNLIVQQQGSEFTFLFFDAESILFTGTQEEQLKAYQELPEVKAKCIAKIVMSAENAMEAANNVIESINRFNLLLQVAKGQENARRETHENTELSTPS